VKTWFNELARETLAEDHLSESEIRVATGNTVATFQGYPSLPSDDSGSEVEMEGPSSNVKPFLWEDKHTIAFEKIKDILVANFSYTEGKSAVKNTVNIIHTNSSLHLMGALLFSYSTENIISSPPENLVNVDEVFFAHLDHYKICCRSVHLELENMNLFHSFITMILQSIHVHDTKK